MEMQAEPTKQSKRKGVGSADWGAEQRGRDREREQNSRTFRHVRRPACFSWRFRGEATSSLDFEHSSSVGLKNICLDLSLNGRAARVFEALCILYPLAQVSLAEKLFVCVVLED